MADTNPRPSKKPRLEQDDSKIWVLKDEIKNLTRDQFLDGFQSHKRSYFEWITSCALMIKMQEPFRHLQLRYLMVGLVPIHQPVDHLMLTQDGTSSTNPLLNPFGQSKTNSGSKGNQCQILREPSCRVSKKQKLIS